MNINKIFIFNTTSTEENANTNARLRLLAELPDADWAQDFPNLPHDERECGRTDAYEFLVSGKGINENTKLWIEIIDTEDGWLPKSIFAIGQTENGEYVVMAANPNWGNHWFDRGANPVGLAKHKIN